MSEKNAAEGFSNVKVDELLADFFTKKLFKEKHERDSAKEKKHKKHKKKKGKHKHSRYDSRSSDSNEHSDVEEKYGHKSRYSHKKSKDKYRSRSNSPDYKRSRKSKYRHRSSSRESSPHRERKRRRRSSSLGSANESEKEGSKKTKTKSGEKNLTIKKSLEKNKTSSTESCLNVKNSLHDTCQNVSNKTQTNETSPEVSSTYINSTIPLTSGKSVLASSGQNSSLLLSVGNCDTLNLSEIPVPLSNRENIDVTQVTTNDYERQQNNNISDKISKPVTDVTINPIGRGSEKQSTEAKEIHSASKDMFEDKDLSRKTSESEKSQIISTSRGRWDKTERKCETSEKVIDSKNDATEHYDNKEINTFTGIEKNEESTKLKQKLSNLKRQELLEKFTRHEEMYKEIELSKLKDKIGLKDKSNSKSEKNAEKEKKKEKEDEYSEKNVEKKKEKEDEYHKRSHSSKKKKHERRKSKTPEKHSRKSHRRSSKERYSSPRKSPTFESRSKFDKEKLREVARRNALVMMEKGMLPETISAEILRKEAIAAAAGSTKSEGKSIKELTDFCRNLLEKDGVVDEKSNEEPSNVEPSNVEEGDQPFLHHPFKVKEASSIKLNIRNSVSIPVKSHAEKVTENARTLSLQFPVSSGNQHRQKELEWVPVEKPNEVKSLNTKNTQKPQEVLSLTPTISTEIAKPLELQDKSTDSHDPVPQPSSSSSMSVLPPLPPPPLPPTLDPPPPVPPPLPPPPPVEPAPPPPPPPPMTFSNSVGLTSYPPVTGSFACGAVSSVPFGPLVPTQQMVPASMEEVSYPPIPVVNYPSVVVEPIDIQSIVTKRFKALVKLHQNPNDMQAANEIHEAERKLQNWIQSQQVPGQFTGSTGVKFLSVAELCGPRPVWVKRDVFAKAAPVSGGKGESLLKKMGWNPGEGLGKNKEGSLEPLLLDIKTDKRGLLTEGEAGKRKGIPSVSLPDMTGKHPVSILMELSSKRKWSPPLYTLISEDGPTHKKNFLFKVEVNNVIYQPSVSRPNKKQAKAECAVVCLQALNVLPEDYKIP